MKKIILLIFIILLSANLYSQVIKNQIRYLDKVSTLSETTLKDAMNIYRFVTGKNLKKYDSSIDINTRLRRGALAKIVADELKLNNSLLFVIFGSERYAYRSCVFAGIMQPGRSTYDIISGNELLEVMKVLADNKTLNKE